MTIKIGFICTGNSARSQIAEGFGKFFAKKYGKKIKVYSAGAQPAGYIHPLAIKVMEEEGIDISNQRSKSLDEIPLIELDYIITLCGDAAEKCPFVPGAKTLHWKLPDPARVKGTEKEKLMAFEKVKNEIKKKLKYLIEQL
ncbi:arsenate reductase ArsC [Desulfurobacterium thermolithotrophum]|uniref:arsenate reductase/protein-tyrosine-phosphatase family protein n=1 Tax=Desulfurobacterium thermolithotrophum TaxID=64160 RepID=UPI0013D598E6